jgi:hypothetical protein
MLELVEIVLLRLTGVGIPKECHGNILIKLSDILYAEFQFLMYS